MTLESAATAEPERTMPAEERHGIVVGIDGGPPSEAALAWASTKTGTFGPVRPVHAWDYALSAFAPSPFGPGVVPPVAEMEAVAETAAAKCTDSLIGVEHEAAEVRRGDAGMVLVDISKDAELLVVGTRGRGPFRSNVIGSVGRHCADHTAVPLVIVPLGFAPSAQSERIVVGVDGSEGSVDALRWAVANASETAAISALTSWQTPIDGPFDYGVNLGNGGGRKGNGRLKTASFTVFADQMLSLDDLLKSSFASAKRGIELIMPAHVQGTILVKKAGSETIGAGPPVPEPSTSLLLMTGLGLLAAHRSRRSSATQLE